MRQHGKQMAIIRHRRVPGKFENGQGCRIRKVHGPAHLIWVCGCQVQVLVNS